MCRCADETNETNETDVINETNVPIRIIKKLRSLEIKKFGNVKIHLCNIYLLVTSAY